MFFILGLPWIVSLCLCVSKWREGIDQKFGFIDMNVLLKGRLLNIVDSIEANPEQMLESLQSQNIWLHAVSFGEVKTVEPLIYSLQEAFPACRICISTGTKTGQDLAKKLFSSKAQNPLLKKDCFVFYCPFDFYFAVKNWLTALRPKFIIIAETEIWPELLFQARQQNIPAFIVNGRLTDKSVQKYKAIKPLMKEALQAFKIIFAQSKLDADRFKVIGAAEEQVQIVDNLKLDSMKCLPTEVVASIKDQLGILNSTFILIAGSTHAGEEEIVFEVYKFLVNKYPDNDIRLILAPRHLERLAEIESLCASKLLISTRKSALSHETDIWKLLILDTMGELSSLYSVANIAFIGGTWVDIGGHNPLEAAAYGMPIFVGSYTYKITDLVELLKEKSFLYQIENLEELKLRVLNLYENRNDFQKAGLTQPKSVSLQMIETIKKNI